MTTALMAKRATATIGKPSDLFRTSFAFLRGLSTTSSAENAAAKKPRRKKKKNLFEVAQFLPNWGIGFHMAKTHWAEVSYEITKINLYKDGRHGKAWGVAHKNVGMEFEPLGGAWYDGMELGGMEWNGGQPIADAVKKISGVHKRCWRYITIPKRIEDSAQKQEASVPKQEVETA